MCLILSFSKALKAPLPLLSTFRTFISHIRYLTIMFCLMAAEFEFVDKHYISGY